MAASVPALQLSHGQVLWCLAGGKPPSERLKAQVRYLRKHGIPFKDGARKGRGRGDRVAYNFHHLIEVGVAHSALRQRIPPRLLKRLVSERPYFKSKYDAAYAELAAHPELFQGDPRERSGFSPELLIQLDDQFSQKPGTIRFLTGDSGEDVAFGDLVQENEEGHRSAVIPLKSVMLSLLKLAAVAPETKPGPKQ